MRLVWLTTWFDFYKMADDAPGMDVDEEEVEQPSSSNVKGDRKRFEVKKVMSLFTNDFNI